MTSKSWLESGDHWITMWILELLPLQDIVRTLVITRVVDKFLNEFFAEVRCFTSNKTINFGADLDHNLLCSEV